MRYEFKCKECGESLVVMSKYDKLMKIKKYMTCPQCNGEMIRVFECNFILKGSGWARDSYTLRSEMDRLDKQAEEEIKEELNSRKKSIDK